MLTRTVLCTFIAALLLCIAAAPSGAQEIRAAFITQTQYGNNLYIDNITAGHQVTTDVGVLALTNIAPDTSYGIGSTPIQVNPSVILVNVGRTNITSPFPVTMTATPGGYTSTFTVPSLLLGGMVQVDFEQLTIVPSTPMEFLIIATLPGDENPGNDSLWQASLVLPGVQRSVLLEEWTSSTCGPCAANNPTIDAFIATNWADVVAVKYHVGWPSPGNDPMYLYNTTQSYDRRYYYGVNAVPHVIMDGVVNPSYPYSDPNSLPDAFALRTPVGAPLSIAVSDSSLSGDSTLSTITLTIHAPLRAGDYKLRIEAIERHIHYATAPGTNGETDFFDVFRRSYPTSAGTAIPTAPGVYAYTLRYKLATPAIMDSVYTLAFVQNDVTREVMNCGKAALHALLPPVAAATAISGKDRCIAENPIDGPPGPFSFLTLGGFNYELFEAAFPPEGWRLANPNNDITLAKIEGVNGFSFGGNACTWIDFYSYSSTNRTDTLFSPIITGLLPTDSLTFDWAYAQYSNENDRLIVKISKNGGLTYDSTIFNRAGAALATAPTTTSPFVPSGPSQWRRFAYPLTHLVTGVSEQGEIPARFTLHQNYPNPFNPSTTVRVDVPDRARVTVRVFDVIGREVAVLADEVLEAGSHTLRFDGTGRASGVYLLRMVAPGYTAVRTMMLVK